MPPATRYVKADGARIAYQVFGEGPLTLVTSAGSFSHTDVAWEDPGAALFFTRLASLGRVVRYDRLGSSNSDPFPADWDPGWKGYAVELEAVLEAVDAQQVVLFAMLDAGPGAIRFAAESPDRVFKLILYNTTARFMVDDDYPIGLDTAAVDSLLEVVETTWGTDTQVAMNVPSRVGDEAFSAWYAKYVRAIGTPTTIAATMRRSFGLDAREYLSKVTAPTLVMHRTGYPMLPVSHGHYLAEHIPGATYLELPGSDGPTFWETPDLILSHIRRFLGEENVTLPSRSHLATVMFTDIVGSTKRLGELGDRQWAALMEVHDEIAGRTVAACGGSLIKSTGDGILATFEDPASALDCARDLRRLLAEMGIGIRVGVHIGQVEHKGNDIGGMAVHIASRVMSRAGEGEIVASRTVHDLVLGSEHHFDSLGVFELKGVEGAWELHRLA
jgi:class 3 adenylate cyclase